MQMQVRRSMSLAGPIHFDQQVTSTKPVTIINIKRIFIFISEVLVIGMGRQLLLYKNASIDRIANTNTKQYMPPSNANDNYIITITISMYVCIFYPINFTLKNYKISKLGFVIVVNFSKKEQKMYLYHVISVKRIRQHQSLKTEKRIRRRNKCESQFFFEFFNQRQDKIYFVFNSSIHPMKFNATWVQNNKYKHKWLSDFNKKQQKKRAFVVNWSNVFSSGHHVSDRTLSTSVEETQFESQVISAFLNKQKLRDKNNFIPAPPKLLNVFQRQNQKMVNKFLKKYQFIWVLICEPDHPVLEKFIQIYEDDRNGKTDIIENILTMHEVSKVDIFLRGGIDIKILSDFKSYKFGWKQRKEDWENHQRVLQIHVQEGQEGERVAVSKKTVSENSIDDFLQETLVEQIQRSRKDIPYYNFIHYNSSPELFNRRNLIQNCLYSKSQEEYLEHHKKFLEMIYNDTESSFNYRLGEVLKKGGPQMIAARNKLTEAKQKKLKINKQFDRKFKFYLEEYYPFQEQSSNIKEEISNWIIIQYSIESSIYPVLNNTIRFSLNSQKIKPVCGVIRYLFEALRYYFTEKHYKYKFIGGAVYRGSRISVAQQRNFRNGQYLWNLGFTSTSRVEKVADQFLTRISNQEEQVKVVIKFSKCTKNADYLWEQEGFCCIDQINEISSFINLEEEEVLFNPLNTFKIDKWDPDKKLLILIYAPQLDIMEKKKNGQKLSVQQNDLLMSLSKLKSRSYDCGQERLEAGDPHGAIKYYEQSQEFGQVLTIDQKQTYIQSLFEAGQIEKIDDILQQFFDEEGQGSEGFRSDFEQSSRQRKDDNVIEEKKQKSMVRIESKFESGQINYQTAENKLGIVQQAFHMSKLMDKGEKFKTANQMTEKTLEMAKTLCVQMPDRNCLILQAKSFVELSIIKFKVNDTLASLKQSIRSLQIIDNLARVDFCFVLYDLGKYIKRFNQIPEELESLTQIRNNKEFFDLDIQEYKMKTLMTISQIVNNAPGQMKKLSVKEEFNEMQKIMEDYFQIRKERTDIQNLEDIFIDSYYELKSFRINTLNYEKDKEKMKNLRETLLSLKNQCKETFELELQVYQTLYQNLYKTNVEIAPCLKSYKEEFYPRYQKFMIKEKEINGQTVQFARFLRKYGKLLCQYGQIIEKTGTKVTKSQKKGLSKLQDAKNLLSHLGQDTETQKYFTYEKTEINNNLSNFYKSHSIDREPKLKSKHSLASLNAIIEQQKEEKVKHSGEMFQSLLDITKQNKQMHMSNNQINKCLYIVKDTNLELQALNSSQDILVSSSSYEDRLRCGQDSYSQALSLLQKHEKEQQLLEKQLNMARLHFLMSQNQFRLGISLKSVEYLDKCKRCLYRALKINPKNQNISEFDKKLLYGNKTKIDSIRLDAHLKAFYGKPEDQKKHLDYLQKVKLFVNQAMNQPNTEADLSESLGLLSFKCLILYKTIITEKDILGYLEESLHIRKRLLGPYNKANARIYTILVKTLSTEHPKKQIEYYKAGHQIYGKIDIDADPLMRIYSMILQTTYLIASARVQEACKVYHNSLNFYDNHQNKLIILEVAREMYYAGSFLFDQKGFRDQGLFWLEKSAEYLEELESNINENYVQDIKSGELKYNKFGSIVYLQKAYEKLIECYRKISKSDKKNQFREQLEILRNKYNIKQAPLPEQKKQFLDSLFRAILTPKQ